MFPDLLQSDTLALDLGIAPSTSDQALKVILKKATGEGDRKLWELLPVLYPTLFSSSTVYFDRLSYACSFAISTLWKDAQFRPSIFV